LKCMQLTGILQPPWYVEYAHKSVTVRAVCDMLVFWTCFTFLSNHFPLKQYPRQGVNCVL